MDPSVCQGLVHYYGDCKDVAEADFGLEFDPTLVMGYVLLYRNHL